MNYLIKKNAKTNEIIYFDYNLDGYTFNPKLDSDSYLNVNKVVIINPRLIDKILTIKFDALFKKIAYKTLRVVEDDAAGEDDAKLVLDEVMRLRSIVLNKYQKFLSREKEELFLKKIRYLENELRVKILMVKDYEEIKEQEYHRTR